MEIIDNLNWSAETSSDWITVSPTAGTGSQDINIKVEKGKYGETDTAGTVTFICGCDAATIIIPVTRCTEDPIPCSKPTEYDYTPITATCESQDVTVNGTYTSYTNCIMIDDVCVCDEITGSTAYTKTLTCNSGSVRSIDEYITQEGDCPCGGGGCDCTELTLSKELVSVNAGSSDTVTVTPNCTTDITVESSDTTKATASYENDTITINGVANGNATITVKYTAGDNPDCSKDITVNVGCPTITINVTKDGQTFEGDIPCDGATITFTKEIT